MASIRLLHEGTGVNKRLTCLVRLDNEEGDRSREH